jgi:hypothetical protein
MKKLHTGLKMAQPRIGNIGGAYRLGQFHLSARRNRMTRMKILGAAAIVASVLTSPAMAQQTYRDHGVRHDRNWQNSYNRTQDRDTGFWPAEAAAGIVGGAVGTAAAIASPPIGGAEYARQNGFVCTPGKMFRGEDGRRHLCQ